MYCLQVCTALKLKPLPESLYCSKTTVQACRQQLKLELLPQVCMLCIKTDILLPASLHCIKFETFRAFLAPFYLLCCLKFAFTSFWTIEDKLVWFLASMHLAIYCILMTNCAENVKSQRSSAFKWNKIMIMSINI